MTVQVWYYSINNRKGRTIEMSVKTEITDGKITAYLSGEIDHHNAGPIRNEIDNALEKNHPEELVLDFSEVSFMDSSGIGLVMGRYKLIKELGGRLIIRNAPPAIKKVMKLAGIDLLATIF